MNTTQNNTSTSSKRREMRGEVVSDRMQDTAVVRIERTVKHPRYGKYITSSKRFKAHDKGNMARVGDIVTIREVAPISKGKRFVIVSRQPIGHIGDNDDGVADQ